MRNKGTIVLLIGIIMLITVILIPVIALSNSMWPGPFNAETMRFLYKAYIALTFVVLIIGIKKKICRK